MLNELEEFRSYTQPPIYASSGKRDTSYMGRFTFQTLMEFEGLGRILTILARGCLFQNDKDPYTQIEFARKALCAWCSIPEQTKKAPEGDEEPRVNFSDLSSHFPELVGDKGRGWLCRHVKGIVRFVRQNPDLVSKSAVSNAEALAGGFTKQWKKKVKQLQVPLFSANTKGAWTLRFDDIIADAIEQGPLQNYDFDLPPETQNRLEQRTPKGVPNTLLPLLAKYYLAHRKENESWVVLPVAAIDAYYGNNSFSKKWKSTIPKDLFEFQNSYGVCRFEMLE